MRLPVKMHDIDSLPGPATDAEKAHSTSFLRATTAICTRATKEKKGRFDGKKHWKERAPLREMHMI